MSKPRDRPEWKMPGWMEPYRGLIGNTGGNSIESLMNDKTTNSLNNLIRSALIVSVDAQVTLLRRLHREGRLR